MEDLELKKISKDRLPSFWIVEEKDDRIEYIQGGGIGKITVKKGREDRPHYDPVIKVIVKYDDVESEVKHRSIKGANRQVLEVIKEIKECNRNNIKKFIRKNIKGFNNF
ncbi:MAG: hypothetical protein ACOCP8_03335 [archaeon]